MEQIVALLPMILIFVLMYVILIVPQRRKDKKNKEMINMLQVGNKVTTIGGISGKIVNIKDDDVIVETSIEKTQIQMKKWAIKDVEKPMEA